MDLSGSHVYELILAVKKAHTAFYNVEILKGT